jgi:bifunctional DNase/RNase
MTQKLELPSASLTSVSIEDLSSGTYYFAVTAYTKSGLESAPSEVVYKTIM